MVRIFSCIEIIRLGINSARATADPFSEKFGIENVK